MRKILRAPFVILADDASRTGLVIEVLDQARLAGVDQVAVAATPD